uniref:Major facilitator superfamily (MFS) profile domain-containing protein n=1 Tax=Parascaris univalens TaxID=6257 RepID=A0A915B1W7_PARUN
MSAAYDDDEYRRGKRLATNDKWSQYKDLVSYTHFEEVLARIKPFGPFQIFACICILFVTIEWAGNYSFVGVLGSVEPDWSCETWNGTTLVIDAPTDDAKCAFIKSNCTQLTAIKSSVEFYSLVAAWKLICDNKDKPNIVQLAQAIGAILGSFVGGHCGDYFGRRKFFFTGQLCIIITSVMATATVSWYTYAICLSLNSVLFGMIEVTALTLMMEYTNNKCRLIPNACFQWPLAYMVTALIAFLTKDWQYFFIFLNLITSPIAIAFMLFFESPRWLVASDQLERACEVLNDIAHGRWNDANVRFTANDLNLIPRDNNKKKPFYNVYHLFCTRRLFRQTLLQFLSVFTSGLLMSTYSFTMKGLHDSAIISTLFHGMFRIFVTVLVVILDFKFFKFGRKIQLVASLSVNCLCYGAAIVILILGYHYEHVAVTVLLIVATVINESVFWMNIAQITTQRYPTVIRCTAFGCIHVFRYVGLIVGITVLKPFLLTRPVWAFAIPEIFVVVTLLCGIILQPETKGKALMDRLIEGHFGRLENEIPKAVMRIAAGHRFNQVTVRERLKQQNGRVQELHEKSEECNTRSANTS